MRSSMPDGLLGVGLGLKDCATCLCLSSMLDRLECPDPDILHAMSRELEVIWRQDIARVIATRLIEVGTLSQLNDACKPWSRPYRHQLKQTALSLRARDDVMPSFTYSSLGGWTVLLRLRASPNFEYFSSFFTRQRTLLGCPTNLETSFPVLSLYDNYSAKPCLQRILRFATNICLRLTMLVSPIVSLLEQAETGNT